MLRFAVADGEGFVAGAREALEALAAQPGYVHGQLCRAYDDPAHWCLVTEWESVGAYRRGLSAYDVRVRATPLLAQAQPEPTAFESLAIAAPGAPVNVVTSDRTSVAEAERASTTVRRTGATNE